jgi:transmembrane sensor
MKGEDIRIMMDRYLAGTASEEEVNLVEILLKQQKETSPGVMLEEKDKNKHFQNLMNRIDALENEKDWEQQLSNIALNQRKRNYIIGYSIAASIALILLVGTFRYYFASTVNKAPEIVYNTYTAPIGGSTYIRLADSSEVWLNAGTTFRYPKQFDSRDRQVEIVDGEAFFKVQYRPFLVRSGSIITQDIGTSFNIKSYKKGRSTSISVITGLVSVIAVNDASKSAYYLHPNEQLRYDSKTQKLKRYKFKEDDLLGWKNGQISFQEERFGDIIEELKRIYQVDIHLKYPKLANYIVSANFPKGTSVYEILRFLGELNMNQVKRISSKEFLIR